MKLRSIDVLDPHNIPVGTQVHATAAAGAVSFEVSEDPSTEPPAGNPVYPVKSIVIGNGSDPDHVDSALLAFNVEGTEASLRFPKSEIQNLPG